MLALVSWMLFLLRRLLIDWPPRVLALSAMAWLGLLLWLHRKHAARSDVTGAEAARRLLSDRGLCTGVYEARGWLVDCYDPATDTIVLGGGVFHGRSVAALSAAAHEAAHAMQRGGWFLPFWLRRLLVTPANLGVALCLWVWLLGAILEDPSVLLAAAGCFGVYVLFLVAELICEMDASRRGVRELLRHGLLDAAEARIARRLLRGALATYLAAFTGSLLGLWFFLASLDWAPILDRLQPVTGRLTAFLP